MCKFDKKNDSRRIDPCMKRFIDCLQYHLEKNVDILACCCGHSRYPMTIVCKSPLDKRAFDICSDKWIERKKKFYKTDADGYYYIPEVSKPFREKTTSKRIGR